MEQSQKIKISSAVITIVLVLTLGYILFNKYRTPAETSLKVSNDTDSQPMKVEVENTQMVSGVLSAPAGFPSDIPLEKENILESVTTNFPENNARQLSVSYQSSRTVAQKYAEYKKYMQDIGYQMTEGEANATVRSIFGTKEGNNLSVAISSADGKTLVQLAYLLTSLSN